MPNATVVISEALARSSDRSPFKAKDGNGETWIRWEHSWDEFLGKKVELVYEEKSREYQGRTYTDKIVSEVKLHEEPKEPPQPGTGDYITGRKPAIEVRRIFASTAWNCAASLSLLEQGTAQEAFDHAKLLADWIFQDLLRKGKAMEDEDVPF